MITNKNILDIVEKILGKEIMSNPVQNTRIKQPEKKLPKGSVLEEGAQIVKNLNTKPIEMLGHVTSSYYSPNLKKSIALAVVRSGKNMKGQKLIVPMESKNINVTVSDFIFLDKDNERLNA